MQRHEPAGEIEDFYDMRSRSVDADKIARQFDSRFLFLEPFALLALRCDGNAGAAADVLHPEDARLGRGAPRSGIVHDVECAVGTDLEIQGTIEDDGLEDALAAHD